MLFNPQYPSDLVLLCDELSGRRAAHRRLSYTILCEHGEIFVFGNGLSVGGVAVLYTVIYTVLSQHIKKRSVHVENTSCVFAFSHIRLFSSHSGGVGSESSTGIIRFNIFCSRFVRIRL